VVYSTQKLTGNELATPMFTLFIGGFGKTNVNPSIKSSSGCGSKIDLTTGVCFEEKIWHWNHIHVKSAFSKRRKPSIIYFSDATLQKHPGTPLALILLELLSQKKQRSLI
jgi:hypothetical protein